MTTKKDSFQNANVKASSANKGAAFRGAMKKCNLAAEFAKRGIDITMLNAQNEKRSA